MITMPATYIQPIMAWIGIQILTCRKSEMSIRFIIWICFYIELVFLVQVVFAFCVDFFVFVPFLVFCFIFLCMICFISLFRWYLKVVWKLYVIHKMYFIVFESYSQSNNIAKYCFQLFVELFYAFENVPEPWFKKMLGLQFQKV